MRNPFAVTPRELEVWRRVALGEMSKGIASDLGLSRKTIDAHRMHLFAKLKVSCAVHACLAAIRHGVITVEVLPPPANEH